MDNALLMMTPDKFPFGQTMLLILTLACDTPLVNLLGAILDRLKHLPNYPQDIPTTPSSHTEPIQELDTTPAEAVDATNITP